jgi:ubiquinone/menaquinone biosynthesis C-methylase UbiE
MDYHGYKVIGLDYAEETIYKIKKSYPQLEVEIGNVMNLPFRDNSFNGYFSLGLIEHFWEGYHDIVQEMRRVLAKGGYLFLTFPYMSLLRRLKANINLFEQYKKEYGEMADFFQFALNKEQVVEVFREEGFRLVDSKPKYGLRGVMDEISWFNNRLTQKCYRYTGRNILIKGPMLVLDKLLTPFAGHVMLMVFQKE